MSSPGDVENAILAELDAASTAGVLGYKYAQLGTYPLNFDDYVLSQQIQFPSAWVVWGAWSRGELQGSGAYQLPARFVLVLAAQAFRNEQATRHGSPGQVGSYQLLMDACALLANQTFGLDINPIRIGAARTLFNAKLQKDRNVNLIALDLETSLFLEAAPNPLQAAGVAPFTDFHVNWDVPLWTLPVGPTLSADADAPATDNVTLEGDDT